MVLNMARIVTFFMMPPHFGVIGISYATYATYASNNQVLF